MWSAIQPSECFGLAWAKKPQTAPHGKSRVTHCRIFSQLPLVLQMSDRFNYVSGWVATSILTTERLKDRVRVVHRWLEIANVCEPARNRPLTIPID